MFNTKNNRLLTKPAALWAVITILALSGCGGGSDSSGNTGLNNTTEPNTKSVTIISGKA